MPTTVSLLSIAGKPSLSRQYGLLVRLQRVLYEEPRCLGAAVVGSLAAGKADRMSDVDLLVYCEAGAAQAILNILNEIAADAPVVHRLAGQHDANSLYEKVILEDWCSYEIHVIEPATRMRLRPPYLEVINRDDYLASRLSEEKPIGRKTVKPYVNGDAGLVWELFSCMKWLQRGEVAHATQYLQSLGEQLKARQKLNEA
ncbi:nucleotidyltransferase domain-containing protein [Aquabacterium sp. OR-4]|uniref:nucleotidyltransferase domain-containing protein n=1 Tax=Aquabacterium sp. OR-4 TaxID=2978127 RepID=UPI0021B1A188|nr:nucleotidyltransferase domain-containing protein [Aquabacterium sp. OR-4]MDT7836919.1 nucleotidyltransferase domain-containing protein [Aquabacterium sp. OR-4]